tara:strand:- start:475 stop:924 length:450 start_codon:yes stop_codon:yes gene_type:complete
MKAEILDKFALTDSELEELTIAIENSIVVEKRSPSIRKLAKKIGVQEDLLKMYLNEHTYNLNSTPIKLCVKTCFDILMHDIITDHCKKSMELFLAHFFPKEVVLDQNKVQPTMEFNFKANNYQVEGDNKNEDSNSSNRITVSRGPGLSE